MAHTIRDDVTNTIGGQLTSATSSIVDLKANLSHVTKTHLAHLERLENMLTSHDNKFTALDQRLSTPSNPPHTTVVDPSLQGCNSSPS